MISFYPHIPKKFVFPLNESYFLEEYIELQQLSIIIIIINVFQATLEGKVHILDCLALAPYFLVVNT